jgi:hypothetical protein
MHSRNGLARVLGNPLHRGHGDIELTITESAGPRFETGRVILGERSAVACFLGKDINLPTVADFRKEIVRVKFSGLYRWPIRFHNW